MKTFKLIRCFESNGGAFGVLVGKGFHCDVMEREWKDNEPFKSCIPEGHYTCVIDKTGKWQYFRVKNVPNRDFIEGHPAMFPHELQGCMAYGETTGEIGGKAALLESPTAMMRFMEHLGGDTEFSLTITSYKGEG